MFSFLENIRHMGKQTNRLTLIDVSGPLAQSAERGADNAKVVSSTLTRTSVQKYFPLFLRALLSVCLCVSLVSVLQYYYIFIVDRQLFLSLEEPAVVALQKNNEKGCSSDPPSFSGMVIHIYL